MAASITGMCEDYESTLDFFNLVLLYAPAFDLPGNVRGSLDEAFAEFDRALKAVRAETQNPEALELLSRCESVLAETFEHYKHGDLKPAALRLQDARDIFKQIGKTLRKRPVRGG